MLPICKLIKKINKVTRLLLCVISIFSIYPWVVPLKDLKRSHIKIKMKPNDVESNS